VFSVAARTCFASSSLDVTNVKKVGYDTMLMDAGDYVDDVYNS